MIDLIVAVPFSLMLESLKNIPARRREGITCFAFGLGSVLLWMALLRFAPNFFWISPIIPWTLIMATVVASLWLKRRLAIQPIASPELDDTQEERELVATV